MGIGGDSLSTTTHTSSSSSSVLLSLKEKYHKIKLITGYDKHKFMQEENWNSMTPYISKVTAHTVDEDRVKI